MRKGKVEEEEEAPRARRRPRSTEETTCAAAKDIYMAARTLRSGIPMAGFSHVVHGNIYEKGSRWRCSLTIDLHRDRAETCARGKTEVWA